MESLSFAAVAAIALILLALLITILSKPLGKMLKLLLHAAMGYALLFAIDYFLKDYGLYLEPNFPNCLIAGLGGVPGVILLAIYQKFFT
jgi:inhibitor of the pro-sigma K processing machinery